ncbi:Beta-galactosidase BgaP [compost metagenome]
MASYTSGRLAGTPAVTRNSFGEGSALYLSARVDEGLLNQLLDDELLAAGVEPELKAPTGVQARRRAGKSVDGTSRSFLMVLNHNDAPASVDVLDGGTDRLTGGAVRGLVELPANGVLILDETAG